MDQKLIQKLADLVRDSSSTVFFGGAGVSTESGVPDFRSKAGIYKQEIGAERILTPGFMNSQTEKFFAFNRQYFGLEGIKPNKAHRVLAALEKAGLLTSIITQNIDGLHQEAGSKRVIELHGSSRRHYCVKCGKEYSQDEIDELGDVPYCPECGGLIRPDIVLYEEGLDRAVLTAAMSDISQADLLIIGGTSLNVYPAAGLVSYLKPGGKIAIINRDQTHMDTRVDLVIHESIGEVFAEMAKVLEIEY